MTGKMSEFQEWEKESRRNTLILSTGFSICLLILALVLRLI